VFRVKVCTARAETSRPVSSAITNLAYMLDWIAKYKSTWNVRHFVAIIG